jgi:hypothetical protein
MHHVQEFVVQKLCIDTTRMSRSEKLAAVLTLGWYWLITRKMLKQARHLTYTITNKRLLQKEEVTGKTAILCNRKTKVRLYSTLLLLLSPSPIRACKRCILALS